MKIRTWGEPCPASRDGRAWSFGKGLSLRMSPIIGHLAEVKNLTTSLPRLKQ